MEFRQEIKGGVSVRKVLGLLVILMALAAIAGTAAANPNGVIEPFGAARHQP
jgi:hypothetical protein